MTQELQTFDELSANITVFVAPTKSVRVTNPSSSNAAIEVAKQIKFYSAEVEKKRKELVGPLNDRVKEINARCKQILAPLDEAESHVRSELNKFANEQELIKQAEMRKIQEERQKAERAEMDARVKAAAELKAKQDEEAKEAADSASFFGEDEEPEAESMTERNERERLELDAKFEQERNLAETARKQAEYDAAQSQVKNARKNYKCELVNIDLVPKEFVIRTLNDKAILAMAKAGTKEIPGVRIWTEMAVAIGAKTYVPNATK